MCFIVFVIGECEAFYTFRELLVNVGRKRNTELHMICNKTVLPQRFVEKLPSHSCCLHRPAAKGIDTSCQPKKI